MANTVKRNLMSDVVILVKARRNKVITATWEANDGNCKVFPVKEMTDISAATPSVLYIAGMYITRLLENEFKGQIGVIMSDDAALKAFAIQKHINKSGLNAAVNYINTNRGFSWMPEDYRDALKDFAEVLQSAKDLGNVVAITKESNLFSWELRGEIENLKDGNEITLIAKRDDGGYWTSTNEDGTIACEGTRVSGTFTVHEFVISSNNSSRSLWRIDRVLTEGNTYDEHIKNLREVYNFITAELPAMPKFNVKNIVREAA